jgi:hypothetical protein
MDQRNDQGQEARETKAILDNTPGEHRKRASAYLLVRLRGFVLLTTIDCQLQRGKPAK